MSDKAPKQPTKAGSKESVSGVKLAPRISPGREKSLGLLAQQAKTGLRSLTTSQVMQLQRTLGNRAVARLARQSDSKRKGLDKAPRPGPAKEAVSAKTQGPTARPQASSTLPAEAVQRKVGLEFQTSTNLWIEEPQKEKLDYGVKVFDLPGQFHIESDDGEVEFVTEPVEEDQPGLDQLVEAVSNMADFAQIIWTQASRVDTGALFSVVAQAFNAGQYQAQWKNSDILVGNFKDPQNTPDLAASPQATVGIPLDKLIDLMTVVTEKSERGDTLSGFAVGGKKDERGKGVILKTLEQVRGQSIYQKLDAHPKLKNFVAAVASYLNGAAEYSKTVADWPKEEEDPNYPKIAHPLMARNNFRTMFNMLEPIEQSIFAEEIGVGGMLELTKSHRATDQIYHQGYFDEGKKKRQAPTVEEWIESIVRPVRILDRDVTLPDKLSRLPGMMVGRGMGALEKPDENVARTNLRGEPREAQEGAVFELRRIQRAMPSDKWVGLAVLVHQTVNEVNEAQIVGPSDRQAAPRDAGAQAANLNQEGKPRSIRASRGRIWSSSMTRRRAFTSGWR